MFTGIVSLGRVEGLSKGSLASILVDMGKAAVGVKKGDSVSINGVCLTVENITGTVAGFSVVEETLRRSNLGALRVGEAVNVERSLKAGDTLGGHLVQGHVDGTGRIAAKRDEGEAEMEIKCGRELTDMMIGKGSVALDGVSLTIGRLENGMLSVYLIPHTLQNTSLGWKKEGDVVNIEVDMIGKYVKRMLGRDD